MENGALGRCGRRSGGHEESRGLCGSLGLLDDHEDEMAVRRVCKEIG